jgi:CheY-like chemotaxis protein
MTGFNFVSGSVLVVQANVTQPFRLLVVDDIEDNRILLSRRFSRRGYLIAEADSGIAALDLIAQQEFDLVLLDVMMPGLNGIDVLKQIRASHSPDTLPVIMITAKAGNIDTTSSRRWNLAPTITSPSRSIFRSRSHARKRSSLANNPSRRSIAPFENSKRPIGGSSARLPSESVLTRRFTISDITTR